MQSPQQYVGTTHTDAFFGYQNQYGHYDNCNDHGQALRNQRERLANKAMAQQDRLAYQQQIATFSHQLSQSLMTLKHAIYNGDGMHTEQAKIECLLTILESNQQPPIPPALHAQNENALYRQTLASFYQKHLTFVQFKLELAQQSQTLVETPSAPVRNYANRLFTQQDTSAIDLTLNWWFLGSMIALSSVAVALIVLGVFAAETSALVIMPPLAGIALLVMTFFTIAHVVEAYNQKWVNEKTVEFDNFLNEADKELTTAYTNFAEATPVVAGFCR